MRFNHRVLLLVSAFLLDPSPAAALNFSLRYPWIARQDSSPSSTENVNSAAADPIATPINAPPTLSKHEIQAIEVASDHPSLDMPLTTPSALIKDLTSTPMKSYKSTTWITITVTIPPVLPSSYPLTNSTTTTPISNSSSLSAAADEEESSPISSISITTTETETDIFANPSDNPSPSPIYAEDQPSVVQAAASISSLNDGSYPIVGVPGASPVTFALDDGGTSPVVEVSRASSSSSASSSEAPATTTQGKNGQNPIIGVPGFSPLSSPPSDTDAIQPGPPGGHSKSTTFSSPYTGLVKGTKFITIQETVTVTLPLANKTTSSNNNYNSTTIRVKATKTKTITIQETETMSISRDKTDSSRNTLKTQAMGEMGEMDGMYPDNNDSFTIPLNQTSFSSKSNNKSASAMSSSSDTEEEDVNPAVIAEDTDTNAGPDTYEEEEENNNFSLPPLNLSPTFGNLLNSSTLLFSSVTPLNLTPTTPTTTNIAVGKFSAQITDISIPTSSPAQSGMISGCTKFILVKKGDKCYQISKNEGMSLKEFMKWNPDVGKECEKLLNGFYVCAGIGVEESSFSNQTTMTGFNGTGASSFSQVSDSTMASETTGNGDVMSEYLTTCTGTWSTVFITITVEPTSSAAVPTDLEQDVSSSSPDAIMAEETMSPAIARGTNLTGVGPGTTPNRLIELAFEEFIGESIPEDDSFQTLSMTIITSRSNRRNVVPTPLVPASVLRGPPLMSSLANQTETSGGKKRQKCPLYWW